MSTSGNILRKKPGGGLFYFKTGELVTSKKVAIIWIPRKKLDMEYVMF